jgi:hypothetical protein
MSNETQPGPKVSGTAVYEIRVGGRLGTEWSDWFTGLRVTAEGAETLLAGTLDQAALHGVLRRVRDLGLPLISVARIQPAPNAQSHNREMESSQ